MLSNFKIYIQLVFRRVLIIYQNIDSIFVNPLKQFCNIHAVFVENI